MQIDVKRSILNSTIRSTNRNKLQPYKTSGVVSKNNFIYFCFLLQKVLKTNLANSEQLFNIVNAKIQFGDLVRR
jgi:hypothetical protein